MRGETVFRVYGVHEGRVANSHQGSFRSRGEAEARIRELNVREMNGRNWARQYHDKGFVIVEATVQTDFEVPSLPKPRDKYVVRTSKKPHEAGAWGSTNVEVHRQGATGLERVGAYERNYALLGTFEPFRQGARELALISRDYTRTAVLDLSSGEVIAEEAETAEGEEFCPVGFFVPDWWDLHDGSEIPGGESWNDDKEWPVGKFGFVWGCHWGDDSSWKVQHLDLSRVQEGILTRDDRFGYVELATSPWVSPTADSPAGTLPSRPDFIRVRRWSGVTTVGFSVQLDFDLDSGRVDEEKHASLLRADRSSDE